jgi:hypothetical protein
MTRAHSEPLLPPKPQFQSRLIIDTSGYGMVLDRLRPWPPTASLETISAAWKNAGYK